MILNKARLIVLLVVAAFSTNCQLSSSTVIDVRGNQELGKVPNTSYHIPAAEMSSRWQELAEFQAQPILLYGNNTAEVTQAAQVLRGQGFQAVKTKTTP